MVLPRPECEEGLRREVMRLPRRAAECRARRLSPLAQTRQRPVVSRELTRAGLARADGGAGEGVEDALGRCTRASALPLVTSRRISRSTLVERKLRNENLYCL